MNVVLAFLVVSAFLMGGFLGYLYGTYQRDLEYAELWDQIETVKLRPGGAEKILSKLRARL